MTFRRMIVPYITFIHNTTHINKHNTLQCTKCFRLKNVTYCITRMMHSKYMPGYIQIIYSIASIQYIRYSYIIM